MGFLGADCNGRQLALPDAGKTSLVRLAAALAGQPLVELALSAGTDTADLLGGFEQLEPLRRVQVPSLQHTSGRKLAGKVCC